jgi:alpha-beta hydrolase superfamily lysophospholipase
MSASAPPRPIYLSSSGAGVFAVAHTPAEPRSRTAVLLCPPFGWDDMCSYRIRREWAQRLADSGHHALRIDLPGSGDSAGMPTDPGQLAAWEDAVTAAAAWLRQSAGSGRTAAIGIGLGGWVACRAALLGAPIEELVLWSVPARGRRLVRELRTFAALETAGAARPDTEPADGGEGELVANGYLLSAASAAELERADLSRLPAPDAPPLRALLLGRDGISADETLRRSLAEAGTAVTVADGPGYGAMMVEPQDARTPAEVMERVDAWLGEGEAAPAGPARTARHPRAAWTSERAILLEHEGAPLRERPVAIERPEGSLFGILAEPAGERADFGAVLFNAGPQRRTGPNRMWVEIARRWAGRGVPTLRLDVAGIGDSDGDASVLARTAEFYKPAYVEQARAALAQTSVWGMPHRLVLLGLCSGAYLSAHCAVADDRVAAVVLLNPRTLVYDEWTHTMRRMRQLRERALLASTWRRALRGELKLARHLETGRNIVGRAAGAPTRARERIGAHAPAPGQGRAPIEDLFDRLRDRGQRTLLFFTGEEVLHRELAGSGVLDRIGDWPNVQLEVVTTPVETHTLTPLWLQRHVHALVDRFLETQVGHAKAR